MGIDRNKIYNGLLIKICTFKYIKKISKSIVNFCTIIISVILL